jgi:flagellar basal body-associated protein FliL
MKNAILFILLVVAMAFCCVAVLICAFFMTIGRLFEWVSKRIMSFGDMIMAKYDASQED